MIKIYTGISYVFCDGLVKLNKFNELKRIGLFMPPLLYIESCVVCTQGWCTPG